MSLVDYYSGKNVFITGATGFMGKVLLEKLLRCIPNIGNIYILIRAKRGAQPQKRLQNLFNLPVSIKILNWSDTRIFLKKK